MDRKLIKVERINNANVQRSSKNFTGKVTTHWSNGEPKQQEINVKKTI